MRTLMRTYQYKLDVPAHVMRDDKEAPGWLASMIRTHCYLYNDALQYKKHCYEKHKDAKGKPLSISYFDLCSWLTSRRDTHPYLSNLPAHSLRLTLKRLDLAYQAFYRRAKERKEKAGFPHFKRARDWDTIEYPSGWRLDGHWLVLNKMGTAPERRLKIRMHRPIPTGANIKVMQLTRKADGWHVSFQMQVPFEDAPDRTGAPSVGIDMGIKELAHTSDGVTFGKLEPLAKAQAALRRAQRSMARKKKGSANRREAVAKVARLHQAVANQRKDVTRKVARTLCTDYGMVAHEALNVKGLAKSKLALQVHDAAWGALKERLRVVGEETGTTIVAVDAKNTTQMCSGCGAMPAVPLKLSDRRRECPECGLSMDRDHNAARNVLARALAR